MDLPNPTNPVTVKSWHQSKAFFWTLKSIVALIAALLIFQLGMFVGFRKASFSYAWGDNYHTIFGGPQGGLMHDFTGRDFMNGHGIVGMIVNIDGNSITIKSVDNAEKMITVTSQTSIIGGRSNLKISDLHTNDTITVIGRPGNDGTVKAGIIRLFNAALTPPPGNFPPPPINY